MESLVSHESILSQSTRGSIKRNYLNKEKTVENDFLNIVQQCFNKRFYFENGRNNWELPAKAVDNVDLDGSSFKIANERWQINELEELKVNLNNVKSKLNSYNFGDWHKHTRSRNPGGLIMRDLRNYEIELLTQAWCKFFELLNVYNIVPSNQKSTFKTFHLCEAPGAFICSLNHYLKLNYPSLEWQWFGSTLNPYYEGNSLEEMINDDRFISRTLKNWWFGEDHTGNLRHRCNLDDLKKFTSSSGPIHLVTADGSVDCCKNPGDQEMYVLPLHYAEVIAALSILSPGGNFVIKIFTTYECETICLLYLLCCMFKCVSVHKPVVSKEGNSEVYVICCDYSGKEKCQSVLDSADYYGEFPRVLFKREDLPESFIEQIVNCSRFFTNTQISVLENNISTYKTELNRRKRIFLWKIRTKVSELFIQLFKVYPLIDPSEYLLSGLYLSNPLQLDQKNEEGTFEDRVESLHPDNRSLLLTYQKNLESLQVEWSWPFVYWIQNWCNKGNDLSELAIIRGKPITSVRSSKFCKGSLLKMVNDLNCFGISDNLLHVSHQSLNKLNEELTTLQSEYIICNVGNTLWLSDYHKAQLECLKCLVSDLAGIKLNMSFVLTGLPLLTQFNLGLMYILGLSFSEVGITNPEVGYAIIFKKLLNFEFISKLTELNEQAGSSEFGLLSVVPISEFLEGELYSCITTCNHSIIKNAALEAVLTLLCNTPQANTSEK